jgi:hypothetical protein
LVVRLSFSTMPLAYGSPTSPIAKAMSKSLRAMCKATSDAWRSLIREMARTATR